MSDTPEVVVTLDDGEEMPEERTLSAYRSIMGGQHYVSVSSSRWSVPSTYMTPESARAYAAALVQAAEWVEAARADEARQDAEYRIVAE